MNLRLRISLLLAALPFLLFGQQPVSIHPTNCPGVPGACGYQPNVTANAAAHTLPPSPQNGNGTLGVIYDQAKCGLDFTTASQRLGKRFTPAGVNQPAPFVISGIPSCAVIEKAYLWAEGSGNGAAQTATINGPAGSASYPMTIIGQGPDKCWGYSGSYTYRADVTASVNGNGTYNISGILTNPPTAGNDMDGATLVVIWSQASATWQGRITIADGAWVVNGGVANYNMPISPAICGPTTNGKAFFCVGDIQFNPSSWAANGTACPLSWNWWDCIQTNTTVNSGQTTSNFNINTGGDCFNLCVTALYSRTTTCATCPTSTTLTASSTNTPASCSACNGSATVNITPAGAYTYAWTPNVSTTNTASNLCAGTYTVTASNACNTVSTVITVPTSGGSITVNNTGQTNVTCNGQCNGSCTVTPTGGSGPYTYSWVPAPGAGGNTGTPSGMCAGSYTSTITDAGGCSGTLVITITQPPVLTSTQSQINVTCNAACNGSASVVASGGTGTYTYNWTPAPPAGQGTASASSLCAGTYTCQIQSPAGCSTNVSFNITQPTPITATSSFTQSTCNQSNGSATVNPSGGTGTYTYSWNSTPTQSTQTATNLPQGTYTCTVTDGSNCTATFAVTVPTTSSPSALLASTNVTCFGACDGTATVSVSSGTAPYTYGWLPSGGSNPNATNLCPGSYTCTVTDANSCTTTAIAIITEPPQLLVSGSQTDVTCNAACNGSATVNASGGTPAYTYAWAPSGGNGPTATSLCAGSYTCTITDAGNCSATQTFTITEPPLLTVAAAGFNVSCFGGTDGQIVVIPTGGSPNYTFAWNNGCTNASCNNVGAGSYTVVCSDMNGCTATASATVTEPPAITISTSAVDAHCNQSDGSTSCTFSGGTGTLNPVWYNPQFTGSNYNNIPAGTYTVIVTDQNGCSDSATALVNNLPGVIATVGPVANLSCNNAGDGSVTINDNGVNSPYTYNWNPNVSASNTASGLQAGSYNVVVTDAAGCTSTVTAIVTQPPSMIVTAAATPNAICTGQTIGLSANVNGGTPAYNFGWMPGQLVGQNPTITPTVSATYTVYVQDSHGCTDSANVAITVNPVPASLFVGDSLSGCQPLCVNFTDNSTIASGSITSWAWDFGDGNTSTSQSPSNCYMTPGPYTVMLTVTSNGGCTNTLTLPNYVDVFANPVAAFTAGPQPTTEIDPTINFTDQSIGATTWLWSFGDVTNSSSTVQNPSFEYPGPGCYDVVLTVSTPNNCIDTTLQQVCIDPDVTLFVPNAFTPNNDGNNDTFYPKGIGLDPDKFEMWIFDRWGNQIYYTRDMNAGWNGCVQGSTTLCQEDVYVYRIKAVDAMGKKHSLIGHVSLIR